VVYGREEYKDVSYRKSKLSPIIPIVFYDDGNEDKQLGYSKRFVFYIGDKGVNEPNKL